MTLEYHKIVYNIIDYISSLDTHCYPRLLARGYNSFAILMTHHVFKQKQQAVPGRVQGC